MVWLCHPCYGLFGSRAANAALARLILHSEFPGFFFDIGRVNYLVFKRNSVIIYSIQNMNRHLLLTAALLTGSLSAPAAEVWAPGVSEDGGWYDYHKTGSNDGTMADTAMCWAASASNVISWWQNHNIASITSSVPQNEKIFDVFKGVYTNGGSKAYYAYDWWVNGDWNVPTNSGWAIIDKGMEEEYIQYANGGFLKDIYDTEVYPITIATDSNNPYAYSEAVVKALKDGYALTISVENTGVAHAYTLWGAEYEITDKGYELTSLWLTDSDDIYNAPQLFNQDVLCLYSEKNGGTGSVIFNNNMGPKLMQASGLRVEPVYIPEPATATLSLAALLGLAARRRRR